MSVFGWVVIGCCALLAAWAAVFAARDRAVILKQLIAGGVIEALILVQMVVAGVLVARGHELGEPITFWGYLVVALLMLPGAAFVAVAERTRWSSVALIVACVTLMVMQLRVQQVWVAA